jgi:hypothetical protein
MRVLPFLAMLTAASPVAAQNPFPDVAAEARDLTFERRQPFAGLNEVGALSQAWSVNTFYALFRGRYPEQTVFWAVRRVAGDRQGAQVARWADSRVCPAVETMLLAMEDLPIVRPDAIALGAEASNLGLVMDGTWHTFWIKSARSGDNNAAVQLEIQGNVNSPVARWWAESAEALAGCWSEAEPGA